MRFLRLRSFVALLFTSLAFGILLPACTKTPGATPPPSEESTAVPGTSSTTKPPGNNLCGKWPDGTASVPTISKQADKQGFLVWQDVGGWHIRGRGSADKQITFTGTITGSHDLTSAKANPDTGATVELKGNRVTFEVKSGAELAGVDLVAGCTTDQLRFILLMDGAPAPVDQIYIGANSKGLNHDFTQERR